MRRAPASRQPAHLFRPSPNRRKTFTRRCHSRLEFRSPLPGDPMRMSFRLAPVLTLAAALSAHAQDASIRVGGSTTALPIISSCAAHFMEKHQTWDKAEAGLGKEQTVVYVTGGGSGFGVKGLMNGTI